MNLTVAQIQQIIREKIPANLVVPEHSELGHFYRHIPTNQLFSSVTTRCGILDNPHLKKWAANMAVQHIEKNWGIITPENREDIFKAAIMAHQDEFEDAGGIGTDGHGIVDEYLQQWIKTGVKPESIKSFIKGDDVRLYAITRSAELFINQFDAIPVASELFVASLKHKYAGTLDSLMMVGEVIKKGEPNTACVLRSHDYWSNSGINPNRLQCFTCGQIMVREFALVDWKTSNSIDKVEYAMQVSAYWNALHEMTGLRPKFIYIVRLDKKQAKYEVLRVSNRPAAFKAFLAAGKIWDWLNNGEEKLEAQRPKVINQINYDRIN